MTDRTDEAAQAALDEPTVSLAASGAESGPAAGAEPAGPAEGAEPGPAAPLGTAPAEPADAAETDPEAEPGPAGAGEPEADLDAPTVSVPPPVVCAACGGIAVGGAAYCEECGAPLAGAPDSGDRAATGGSAPAGVPGSRTGPQAAAPAAAQPGTDPDEELPSEYGTPPDAFGSHDPDYGSYGGYGGYRVQHVAAPAPAEAIRVCSYCQGTIAPDGYCLECGEREVSARDRFGDRPASWLAGVSDLGLVHRRNEDALSLAVVRGGGAAPSGTAVLVVCDGVTTAPDSDVASLAAAQASAAEMTREVSDADPRAPRQGLLSHAIRAGHAAATHAVLASAPPDVPEADAPSCTFVAALAEPGTIVVGWVGDSRAYWFPDVGDPVQISTDHSWAVEMMAEGMTEAEAFAAPNAHAITRWVGRDAPEGEPEIRALHPDGSGLVLVCSDGLWNYCSGAAELADLVARTEQEVGSGPAELAVALVSWARAQGGRDNISVALARLGSLNGHDVEGSPAGASAAPAAPADPDTSAEAAPIPAAEPSIDPTASPAGEPKSGKDTDGDVQR